MASLRKTNGRAEDAASESNPLPEKIAVVLQESRWLALIALAGFLGLALWGYHRGDPGWSHAVHGGGLHNPAGRGGAWIADLLLYVFGLSAWWSVILLVSSVWRGYRRLDGLRTVDQRPMLIALAGFVLLLVASSGLETLRFYTLKAELPLAPGGIMGVAIGETAVRFLGYTGATMALLAALAVGWSIFSGMSWLTAIERIGTALELSYFGVRNLIDRIQDRRIGREVAREREAVVEVEKKRVEAHEPIFIEVPEPMVPVSSKVEKRIERERQAPLFYATSDSESLYRAAASLVFRHDFRQRPCRSLGVRACNLVTDEVTQCSLYPEIVRMQQDEELERAVDRLRDRFGPKIVQRGMMLTDRRLAAVDPKGDHILHPESFFR